MTCSDLDAVASAAVAPGAGISAAAGTGVPGCGSPDHNRTRPLRYRPAPQPSLRFWRGKCYDLMHLETVAFKILLYISVNQCCGSMTFWYGSGSAGPCLWLKDPDPAIFVIDLQDANKKLKSFSAYFFLKVHLHHFKDKKSKRCHTTAGIMVLFTIFAWRWKDLEPDPYLWLTDPDPGGPNTYGSGSPTLVSTIGIQIDYKRKRYTNISGT